MEDAASLGEWLPGALASAIGNVDEAGRLAVELEARVAGGDRRLRLIQEAGEPVGVVDVEAARRAVRMPLLVVRREARERGVGARAVAIVEGEAGRRRRFLGALAPGDGRSLYFWLRLGYRPVPIESDGGRRVWMERKIERAP